MQIQVVTAAQAQAKAKTAKVSTEQEAQILKVIQELTKDEGIQITAGDTDNLGQLKKTVETIAASEGVNVVVKVLKSKKLILVWRSS